MPDDRRVYWKALTRRTPGELKMNTFTCYKVRTQFPEEPILNTLHKNTT